MFTLVVLFLTGPQELKGRHPTLPRFDRLRRRSPRSLNRPSRPCPVLSFRPLQRSGEHLEVCPERSSHQDTS